MRFSTETKLTCVAIINVFETSRSMGDAAAFAVLDDGAGISYGIGQFTHRSGSLAAVVDEYIAAGGVIGRRVLAGALPLLRRTDAAAIRELAADRKFETALRAAAISREMRAAQTGVLLRVYLGPAVDACGELGLELPLSLAVVFDSIVHGSWAAIRSLVALCPPAAGGDEKAWVTAYVRRRHAWLTASPRLKKTAYRTRFFLEQIMLGRWRLELPISVRGVRLTRELLFPAFAASKDSAAELAINSTDIDPPQLPKENGSLSETASRRSPTAPSRQNAQPPKIFPRRAGPLESVEASVARAAAEYDRVESVVTTVISRKDAAKSLWTTVLGTVWQTAWAVAGFVYEIPRSIWMAAAIIVGVLAAAYLYRQIALAKIRERTN